MSKDIQILIQNYQGTFVLDILNEFRKDAIRSIFRDMVLPPDAESSKDDAFKAYSNGLKKFLTSKPDDWLAAYKHWSGKNEASDVVSILFSAINTAATKFLKQCASKNKTEVWAYLYSKEFSEMLRVSPPTYEKAGTRSLQRAESSIAGLFNVVGLTINHDSEIRLIQPPDISLNESFHTLQACFPLLSGDELKVLAAKFRVVDYIHINLENNYGLNPPLCRGATSVHYDTSMYEKTPCNMQFLEKSRDVHNTSFLQIRPLAEEQGTQPFCFFQLQCTLPGLMQRLIPPSCAIGRKSLSLKGADIITTTKTTETATDVFQIEFDDKWWEDAKHPPYFLMRMRTLAAGWPRRLFNFFKLAVETSSQLQNEILARHEEIERWKRRQVDEDVKELVDRLAVVSAVAHRVQRKIRPASSGIFSLHSHTQLLFVPKIGLVGDIAWTKQVEKLANDYIAVNSEPPKPLVWETEWESQSSKVNAVVILPESERDVKRNDYILSGMVGCHQENSVGESWPGLARGFFLVACASRNQLLARLACGKSDNFAVLKMILHRSHAPNLDADGNQIGCLAQIAAALADMSLGLASSKPIIELIDMQLYNSENAGLKDDFDWTEKKLKIQFIAKKRSIVETLVALQQLIGEELVAREGCVHATKVTVKLEEGVKVKIELSGEFPLRKLHWSDPHPEIHGLTGCFLKICEATGCPFPNAGDGLSIQGKDICIHFAKPKEIAKRS